MARCKAPITEEGEENQNMPDAPDEVAPVDEGVAQQGDWDAGGGGAW